MSEYLQEMFGLRGRVAVVTGGSSGMGFAIAHALGSAGAAVTLIARTQSDLDARVAELAKDGVRANAVAADLSNRDDTRRAGDAAAAAFGEADILVNAAASNPRPPWEELTIQQWDACLELNTTAPYLLGMRFGPDMAQRGYGRIINIASQQSVRAFGNSGVYGVSKSAMCGLTRSQAEAWSAAGVCCNAIVPGFVRTPLTEPVFRDAERPKRLAARTMIGRNGLPADIAGIALFLAGPGSSFITGQTMFADGGFSVT